MKCVHFFKNSSSFHVSVKLVKYVVSAPSTAQFLSWVWKFQAETFGI
jgi:hypothetical protein